MNNIEKGTNSRIHHVLLYELHLTRVHCATFNQSAEHHKQHKDVTLSSRRSSRGFQRALSKPIQCWDRISFELERVLLNLTFSDTA